jgi:hypothetical protein
VVANEFAALVGLQVKSHKFEGSSKRIIVITPKGSETRPVLFRRGWPRDASVRLRGRVVIALPPQPIGAVAEAGSQKPLEAAEGDAVWVIRSTYPVQLILSPGWSLPLSGVVVRGTSWFRPIG